MTNTSLHPSERLVGYSEALATWTTRYIDPAGYECLLSIQAETGSEVLTKAEGALERLAELKCVPHSQKQPNNGNEQKKFEEPTPTIQVKQDASSEKPICPIHGVEMTKWNKNGRSWHAHRWNDGWCNGKAK